MPTEPSDPDQGRSDSAQHRHQVVALSDLPAEADAFGGHARVAGAIQEVLLEHGGRTIGLEGEWGSGKSTIVRLVCKGLGPNFRAFVFDAWSHEGDPLRRSFLESLIRNLMEAGWIDRKSWAERIERLARRRRSTTQTTTQELTRNGRLLAASLFIIPVGTALLGRWLGQRRLNALLVCLGVLISLFPLLLAGLLWGFAYTRRRRLKAKGVPPRDADEFHPLALLAKADRTIQQSETLETPEPTSIEFFQEFDLLLSEALSTPERRLLIVLDNLDRVVSSTAEQVLATLQTFIGVSDSQPWSSQVWVLLPYDKDGLRDLWPKEDLVNQFLGKIRQLRFDTPPLVLSDWREHLRDLLTQALPDTASADLQEVVRVIATARIDRANLRGADFAAAGSPPTPRELIQLVNEVGSTYRQRQDVPLSHVAYFAFLRQRHVGIAPELLEGHIPSPRIDRLVGPGVGDSLATLYFNVEVARARQLLFAEPLSAALVRGEPEVVRSLASYPGFWEVFESLPFEDWAASGGADFAQAASTIAQAQLLDQLPGAVQQTLKSAMKDAQSWRPTTSDAGDGLGALLEAVHPGADPAAELLAKISERDVFEEIEAPELRGRVEAVVALLKRLAISGLSDTALSARIVMPGSAAAFLSACDILAQEDEEGIYWRVLQPSVEFIDVMSTVAAWVGQPTGDGRSIAALRVLASDPARADWGPVAEAFGSYLRDPNLAFSPAVTAALEVVDVAEGAQGGLIPQLAAQGWLLNDYFLAHNAGAPPTAALAGFLHLTVLPAVPEPPPEANATTGASLLRECLSNPESQEAIADSLTELTAARRPELVFEVTNALPQARPWAEQCIQTLAASGRLGTNAVVEHWALVNRAVDDAELNELLRGLIRTDGLLTKATAEVPAELEVQLFTLLAQDSTLGREDEVRALRRVAIDRLNSLSADEWYSELTSQGLSVDLLRLLRIGEPRPQLGVPFQEALIRHGAALAKGETSISEPSQWPTLLESLAADHFRSAVANGLTSELARLSGPFTENFFDAYGDVLAQERQVLKHDQLLSTVFASAIQVKDSATLTWATKLLEEHPEVLQGLQPPEKVANLKELAKEALREEELSEELSAFAGVLGVATPK